MSSKSVKRITWNILILVLSVTLMLVLFAKASSGVSRSGSETKTSGTQEYESRLFDTSYVHEIDIQMDAQDYTDMLEYAIEKNKYEADVIVDGELFYGIAISTKGSASLKAVASDEESDRYSLKLIFDKYDSNQTYYGLETIHLNNNVSDASYMRDYISYSLFREIGCPSPLVSYAEVTVNGEPYGFFTVLENIGEGFLNRNLKGEGELYKPESNSRGSVSRGADLTYQGNLEFSYTDIFDNSVTDCSDKDKQAVIKALKKLAEGREEEGVDTDLVCRYFAAHNFTLNSDSYLSTSGTLHNYFLYENNGVLAMLPWDYNNAYALSNSIQMGFFLKNAPEERKERYNEKIENEKAIYDASYFVNKGIDTPLMGESDSRPMWSFIPENDEYLKLYHSYMDELITNYFESGAFKKEFNRIYKMIRPYIKQDASGMYTMEEVDAEVKRLKTICTLRAESIRKQLNGQLSCDSSLQNEADRVDASCLD